MQLSISIVINAFVFIPINCTCIHHLTDNDIIWLRIIIHTYIYIYRCFVVSLSERLL